ncbi:MAG: tRNA (guanosine(46)-N7)-methyltransferase TrmB [Clostridia bacterium]|nr:tRNA (guanosine(46)-N7)-methyltransferase TrmB [Clostridia bacterium]
MRMRKKKHLEEKLMQCKNLIDIPPVTQDFRNVVAVKEYIDFSEYFKNNNPIQMEIGCGKGQFIFELAQRNPEINYIAVEVNRNVICDACKKAQDSGLSNVIFLHCGAEILTKYIKPSSIERLYLNFSCPFPKNAYENRRLTNVRFLDIYKEILSEDAEIHQKTDNMHFFEYSIEQYTLAGYKLKNISLDLHNSDFEGNIITEYENRFSSMGMPIYRLEAYV